MAATLLRNAGAPLRGSQRQTIERADNAAHAKARHLPVRHLPRYGFGLPKELR
jgi:hypothetical protein